MFGVHGLSVVGASLGLVGLPELGGRRFFEELAGTGFVPPPQPLTVAVKHTARAAICWSPSSRVAVIGKLYASQFCGPFRTCDELEAIAKIKFQRTNGNWTKNYTYKVTWTSFSWAMSKSRR